MSKALTPVALPSVEICTDGGCEPNPGPGGYRAVLIHPRKRAEISGGFRKTTYTVESARRLVERPPSLF
jgi:hypothetical protein